MINFLLILAGAVVVPVAFGCPWWASVIAALLVIVGGLLVLLVKAFTVAWPGW